MKTTVNVPRLVVSSYKGKVGKTLVAMAIAHSLIKAGYRVSMFKVGPDYIDPSYHRIVTGVPSRNLDYVLMPRGVLRRFAKYSVGSDVALIEGVAGLYDSVDGISELGSTAQVAKALRAPVALVINGERINRTVRALVRGLREFDKGVKVVGAVLTNVVPRQIEKLVRAVEDEGLVTLGIIPRSERIVRAMEYRHLGLVHIDEGRGGLVMTAVEEASKGINVDLVLKVAREYSEPLDVEVEEDHRGGWGQLRIGIMGGRPFTFYYPETIEGAMALGQVRFIDPEVDQGLGELDMLLIGGGFPEVYAEELERNRAMRSSVRSFIEKGGLVYAECGGLMYLSKSIIYNNEEYEMVGLIDGLSVVLKRPAWYGYAVARVIKDTPIAKAGTVLRGHEFHHSRLVLLRNHELSLVYERGLGVNGMDGFVINNAYAHYLHIHPETYDVVAALVAKMLSQAVGTAPATGE